MDIFKLHEKFEIEALEGLKNADLLRPLVFGGGTMMRLCYGLNRYSTDLDFWFVKKVEERVYFNKAKKYLESLNELTDAKVKANTLLFEMRSKDYPKRLKIEIRRGVEKCDFEEKIAFSKYDTKQVLLRVHTLEQTMENKIKAALGRKNIRDFFDIEFLLRRGIAIGSDRSKLLELKNIAGNFRESEFKVTLGSVLDTEARKYYVKNKFDYLIRVIG
ncbi:MAG: nucleotidyl transferase AbiEii/AbiGii toxin family protein [Candidatus Omnitrophica bacterium]|nr:nucleotidyl transferase AbiEii/AbiGii toxin family protein [Candidatus Omnitrophota bacterium]